MRTKNFDIDHVLDKAVQLFWAKGYEATSIPALERHMGIKRQSLYDTFGSKHRLFLSSLAHYHDRVIVKNLATLLTAPSPKEAIKAYFLQRVSDLDNPDITKGCLVTNSLTELGLSDVEVKKQTRKTLEYMEKIFYEAVVRAQECGEVDSEKDAKVIAIQLLNNAQGLFVMSKSGMDKKKLTTLVNQFLTVLDN